MMNQVFQSHLPQPCPGNTLPQKAHVFPGHRPIGPLSISWQSAPGWPSQAYPLGHPPSHFGFPPSFPQQTPGLFPQPQQSPFYPLPLVRNPPPVLIPKVSVSSQTEEEGPLSVIRQPPTPVSSDAGIQTDRPDSSPRRAELSHQDFELRAAHLNSRFEELTASMSVCPPGPDLQLFGTDPPPVINSERLELRNQLTDILHILKVRRYWQNPAAPSPNIFKRRIKKISKLGLSHSLEVEDLSRQKTYDKKHPPGEKGAQEGSTHQLEIRSNSIHGASRLGYSRI